MRNAGVEFGYTVSFKNHSMVDVADARSYNTPTFFNSPTFQVMPPGSQTTNPNMERALSGKLCNQCVAFRGSPSTC